MWHLAFGSLFEGYDSTDRITIDLVKAENSACLQVKWLEHKATAVRLGNGPLLLK